MTNEICPPQAEQTIDFMASTHAFREYLGQTPPLDVTLGVIPADHHHYFHHRLDYYRALYCPQE